MQARTASTKSSSESRASTVSEPGRPAASSEAAKRNELSIQSRALPWPARSVKTRGRLAKSGFAVSPLAR